METDLDDDELVNVFEIVTDISLGEIGVAFANDEISTDAVPGGYLVCDMPWKIVLAFGPVDGDLTCVNNQELRKACYHIRSYSLVIDVQVMPGVVTAKTLSVLAVKESHDCGTVSTKEEYLEYLTTSYRRCDVCMICIIWNTC
jgi:hypothetical protein